MLDLMYIVTFFISLIIIKLTFGIYDLQMAGRIAMSIMLLFTSIAHFKFVEGMAMMVPDIIPNKKLVVYITGYIEIAAAIGLLFSSTQYLTAWFLILFFIVLLPANIHAALKKVNFETGTYTGNGTSYLWFRIPLQIFFIAWVYFSCIFINNQGF
jgi:uncharacterized membrane protein